MKKLFNIFVIALSFGLASYIFAEENETLVMPAEDLMADVEKFDIEYTEPKSEKMQTQPTEVKEEVFILDELPKDEEIKPEVDLDEDLELKNLEEELRRLLADEDLQPEEDVTVM